MKSAQTRIAASSLALLATLWAGSAQAAGVTAGTLIANTATATYDTGAASVSVQSNTVTVRVDELLDVAVATLGASPTDAGAGTSVLTFRLTNTGNGPEGYRLTADPAIAGNDFNAVVQSIAIDSNGNGVYDAGVDQIVATGAATPDVAPDTALTVFVLVTLPTDAADGETAQVRLTAAASTGTGTAGTVFAGQGSGGGDAVTGVSTAQDDALATLRARLALVALTKSAAIRDPFGGVQPVPGAVVTYTLAAAVSGAGTASNLRITDAIPTGTTYEPGTLTLEGTALTDVADGDAGRGSSAGIEVGLGSVAGGTTRTVTFKVKVN